jgi:hypothetical protein
MINEKILFHYRHTIVYLQDDQNAIGATTSITLRTVTSHNDTNCKYVRKFGTDYLIKDVTDIEDPVDVNMIFRVYAEDGTLLGSRTGGGAFVDGSAVDPAQPCYMEIEASGGNVTVLATITVDTDVDAGGKTFVCAAETVTDGDTLTLYLSETTSTYYDSDYKYGGGRHVPTGVEMLPYFHPEAADAALGGAFTIVTVLDSETYEVEDYAISLANTVWQSALGQAATLTNGVGARETREVSTQYNNITAIYFNKSGNDANSGSWQNPKLTIAAAIASRAGRDIVYGGMEATITASFPEFVTFGTDTLESDYGYTPTITHPSSTIISLTSDGAVKGFIIIGNLVNVGVGGIPAGAKYVYDCSISNCSFGIQGQRVDTIRNKFINNSSAGYYIYLVGVGGAHTETVQFNYFDNNYRGIRIRQSAVVLALTLDFDDNIIINNSESGFYVTRDGSGSLTISGSIDNNLLYNNGFGFWIFAVNTAALTADNDIFHSNNTAIYTSFALTINYCNFYNNDTKFDGVGVVTSNNEIAGDPKLCKITSPYEFGLSSDSPCYRADAGGDDIGPKLRIIEINESDIEINGFIIDGQEYYNNAIYILDTVNHIGNINKWCTIEDFQGIAGDPYDDNTNTECQYLNCIIRNNGNGIKLSYGGNIIQECLIYGNTIFSIWSDYTSQTFNHNIFYGNYYGIYFESNTTGIIIKNCIFHGNSWRDISSEVSISTTYCCITGATDNVDISNTSNITDDPLFENVTSGSEDFHIKTTEGGYIHNSPCKDASDDDPVQDIGAYNVVRSVTSERWLKYQLETNPRDLNPFPKIKGEVNINNAEGSLKRYGVSTKRVFPFQYSDDDEQTEEQKNTLEYLALGLIPGVDELTEDDCEILLHILPNQKLFTGTSGMISATAKTIDDAAQEWQRNQFKGYWVGVKFTSGVDLVIDSAAKTATKAGAGWTVNEWTGYYFYHNYYYYRILSNTATVLTLSDPDDTLINETASTYAIEKYFKILQNSKNQLLLEDKDDELVTGSYDYYIDFIKVQSINKNFTPIQDGFYYQKEFSKTGFPIAFEEK